MHLFEIVENLVTYGKGCKLKIDLNHLVFVRALLLDRLKKRKPSSRPSPGHD